MRLTTVLLAAFALAACTQEQPGCGNPDVIQSTKDTIKRQLFSSGDERKLELVDIRTIEGDHELGNYSCAAMLRFKGAEDEIFDAGATVEGPVRFDVFAGASNPGRYMIDFGEPDIDDFTTTKDQNGMTALNALHGMVDQGRRRLQIPPLPVSRRREA